MVGDGTFSIGVSDGDWYNYIKWTAPSGGTWQYFCMTINSNIFNKSARISGGNSVDGFLCGFAIRVA